MWREKPETLYKGYDPPVLQEFGNTKLFLEGAVDKGVWSKRALPFHDGVSYAHSDADTDQIVGVFGKGLNAAEEYKG
jgi:hypothetical protein